MKPSPNRRHYRIGKRITKENHSLMNCDLFSLKDNSKHIVILMAIIYVLTNIISFMLGRICYERRHC